MADDITATFTIREFTLLRDALERLHFFSGEQIREQAKPLLVKVNALLPLPGASY